MRLMNRLIADGCRKGSPQVLQNVLFVVPLETPIAALMKMDEDGHDFTRT
jgi:hypothetical protein